MIKYIQNDSTPLSGIVLNLWGNPNQFKDTVDREMMASSGYNDGRGPQRNPKDFYVLIGAIIGIVVCCTIGVIIGARLAGFGGIFLGIVAGLFIGGIGGSWLGEKYKNRKLKPRKKKGTESKRGPFVD